MRATPSLSSAGTRFLSARRGWAIAGAAGLAIVLVALIGGRLREQSSNPSVAPDLTQFTWSLPAGTALDSAPIVSPNGRRIAFTAVRDGSTPRLFVWSLDSRDPEVINGTNGAKQPFWSPDGMSLGYFSFGKLMKVAVAGGVPVVICNAPDGKGGAWSPTGTIVFGPDMIFEGLAQVSADGGPVQPATLVDFDRGENSHRWPVFLPDGIHFLFFVRASIDERRGVWTSRASIGRRPRQARHSSDRNRRRSSCRHPTEGVVCSFPRPMASCRSGPLMPRRSGSSEIPRTLLVAAGANTPYHSAMLSASADLLATVALPMPDGVRLGTVARDGTAVRLSERQPQNWPRLSPDGRRMARQIVDPTRGNPDIWVEELQDGSLVRVTTDTGSDALPVWSPDGRRLAYGSGTLKERRLSIAAADGTGVAQELPCPAAYCEPTDWSPDGRALIVNTRLAMIGAGGDVWSVSLEAGVSATPVLSGPFREYDARISPNGQWLAYVSEEAGRPVVSVRAMSGEPKRVVVSGDGGSQPVWRRDGHELLYVDLEGRLRGRSVSRQPTGELTLGVAKALSVPLIGSGHWGTQDDVSPDGQYAVLHRPDAGAKAERHPCRDGVACPPPVGRADERRIRIAPEPYAALWKSSIWRIQLVSGFHLGKIWATNSKSLIPND